MKEKNTKNKKKTISKKNESKMSQKEINKHYGIKTKNHKTIGIKAVQQ